MKKLLMLGLLLSSQLNLIAVSADFLKTDSHIFCDALMNHNNNLYNVLDKNFLVDANKLIDSVQLLMKSLDGIASIQQKSGNVLTLEQSIIVNKHIFQLNVVRKKLMEIRSTYDLSDLLRKGFDGYRNSLDKHYYHLHPSYESYLLKEYNVSLKEFAEASLYATGSVLGLGYGYAGIACGLPDNDWVLKGYKRTDTHFGILSSGVALTALGAYLARCAFKTVHNPEYEFELIVKNK